MLQDYTTFFVATVGAAAGFIGLLFVALSVALSADTDHGTRERRLVLAGGSFAALLDCFFVSIIYLVGGVVLFAGTSIAVALLGLLTHAQLVSRAVRAGVFSRGAPNLRLNIAFASVAISLYSAQLGLGAAMLFLSQNGSLLRVLIFVPVALFASALWRAWEMIWVRDSKAVRPR